MAASLQQRRLLAALQGRGRARPLGSREAAAVLGLDGSQRDGRGAVSGYIHRLRQRGVPVRTAPGGEGWYLADACPVLPRPGREPAARPERTGKTEPDRLRAMWMHVLMRGIADAAGRVSQQPEPGQRAATERAAQAWLGSRDFRAVCELAGFEPDAVLERVRCAGVEAVAARLTGVEA